MGVAEEKNQKKQVLGKGLASLIRNTSQEAGEIEAMPSSTAPIGPATQLVDISMILANKLQPRKIFKERELLELAQSIKENGIIQPLIVTMTDGKLELIAGERRLRAAKLAGLDKVPVVFKTVTDKEKLVMAIIENVQRADLNCIEEALAYYQLMEDFKITQEEVAKRVGKDRSTVANFLRLLRLPRDVIARLQKDELSFGHGKVLAAVKEPEFVVRLAQQVVEKNLSVRELEELIKRNNSNKVVTERKKEVLDERMEQLREKLEKRTGFHFKIHSKNGSSGSIQLNFSNEAEFNDIYLYLMKSN